MKLPEPIHQTKTQVIRWRESRQNTKPRDYLGASIIGRPCKRDLWYSFRNAKVILFDGQRLRLFDTGHREEIRIIEELRGIGCEVVDRDPANPMHQISVSEFGGHMKGHIDAMLIGLPEAPKKWHVGEFKTHNEKSFNKLKYSGVKESKPEHYSQMIFYMGTTKSDRGLYYAINKNDDDIYVERIEFDKDHYNKILDKALEVIESATPPLRISEDPSWYQCKMCDHHDICHGTELPLPNCRSCAHSTPDIHNGGWTCAKDGPSIHTHDAQLVGCDMHRYIPDLLSKFAEMKDANEADNWVKYMVIKTGAVFYNGDYTSAELYACKDKSILGDEGLQELRHGFDAKVIE